VIPQLWCCAPKQREDVLDALLGTTSASCRSAREWESCSVPARAFHKQIRKLNQLAS
jgi:hypothetical protein